MSVKIYFLNDLEYMSKSISKYLQFALALFKTGVRCGLTNLFKIKCTINTINCAKSEGVKILK